MTDISVIILTGNEELHIKRCLEKLAPLEPRQIFVVESQKGDNTHSLAISTARTLGWSVCEKIEDAKTSTPIPYSLLLITYHQWPGLQSTQFNWALDNLPIEGEWVLRLDADEYLTDESIAWLKSALSPQSEGDNSTVRLRLSPSPISDVNALEFTLERKFCGGVIRHGTNGIKMVRMFRRGHARYAETAMDERLIPSNFGKTGLTVFAKTTPVIFYDDSLMPMSEWREKHRGYAKREAAQAIESMESGHWVDPRKASYYKLPPYLRAFIYFAIRYFLKLGFLDGYAGWMWNFWQGLWYRCLVDYEIKALKHFHL